MLRKGHGAPIFLSALLWKKTRGSHRLFLRTLHERATVLAVAAVLLIPQRARYFLSLKLLTRSSAQRHRSPCQIGAGFKSPLSVVGDSREGNTTIDDQSSRHLKRRANT